MKAWHFLREDGKLRDGKKPPKPGKVLKHKGDLIICCSGLHASRKPLDALALSPGPIICCVEVGGVIIEGDDKLVATERTILWRYNCTDVLWHFARLCALDVIHLWDAPDVVIKYLKTGDESLRAASWDASWAASCDASRAASWDASCDASWAVSCDASRAARRAASWAAQNKRLYRLLMKGRPE